MKSVALKLTASLVAVLVCDLVARALSVPGYYHGLMAGIASMAAVALVDALRLQRS